MEIEIEEEERVGTEKPAAPSVLRREGLSPDPLVQLRSWFREAERSSGLVHPNAMCLSTVDPEGRPEGRIVLLKGLDEQGVVFYTNFSSQKARAMEANPVAALTFHWEAFARQVRLRGPVAKVSDDEADAYFRTRPRRSRLGAWASQQSAPLESRATLEARMREMEDRFGAGEVPRPPFWGGYRVAPDVVEFWQGGADRLHDRFRYGRASDGSWSIARIYP